MAPRGKAPGSRRLLIEAAEVAAAPGARASGSGSWPRLALRLHLYLINAGGCIAALTLDVLVLGERLQPLGTGSFIPPAFQLWSLPPPGLGLTSGAAPWYFLPVPTSSHWVPCLIPRIPASSPKPRDLLVSSGNQLLPFSLMVSFLLLAELCRS